MNFWLLLAIAFACLGSVVVGATLACWCYYCGTKQCSPMPQIGNPVARLFRQRGGGGRAQPTENGDGSEEESRAMRA